jgi:CDP-diacylglycerol--serine O-phosphatidyltransferase
MKDQRRRGVYLIPNLLTTGNLFSGFYAIIAVMNANYIAAAIAILVAMVFDSLDGKWARMTKTTSLFGVEYDSLADLVSFGLAPGLLIYSWALSSYGRLGWVAAFLFVVCGALRLARYNVQSGSVESRDFSGLPIPAAAAVIASLVLMDHHILRLGKEVKPLLIVVLIYILAFLMVSTFRYRSFKEMHLWGRKPFRVLVTAVLLFIVLAAEPQIMLFALFAIYALSGVMDKPVRWLYAALRRWLNPSAADGKPKVKDSPT